MREERARAALGYAVGGRLRTLRAKRIAYRPSAAGSIKSRSSHRKPSCSDWKRPYPAPARKMSPAIKEVRNCSLVIRYSRGFGKRVLELIRMLSVGDLDRHLACQTHQLTGAGVRHHSDRKLRCAPGHCAAVLQHEGAAAALERSAHPLDRNITGRAFDFRASGQHHALAGPLEIAVE